MPEPTSMRPEDVPDVVEMTAAAICNNDNSTTWDKVRKSTADRYRRLAIRTLNVVAPEIERRARADALRTAADDWQALGTGSPSEFADWLRQQAAKIAGGES
ncbi:hypothetical protein [Actinomadura yumaensis]|uniref:Uncharacterized protein n=1 Tax=Actinomadura yumaensis TaxID=111807 RepID=A0ABW2CR77_9ACTN